MTIAQPCDCTKNHPIAHCKHVTSVPWEIHFNKALQKFYRVRSCAIPRSGPSLTIKQPLRSLGEGPEVPQCPPRQETGRVWLQVFKTLRSSAAWCRTALCLSQERDQRWPRIVGGACSRTCRECRAPGGCGGTGSGVRGGVDIHAPQLKSVLPLEGH